MPALAAHLQSSFKSYITFLHISGDADKEVASIKREGKRKRKRNAEREKVNGDKSDSPTQSEGCSRDNSDSIRLMGSSSVHNSYRSAGK